MLAMADIVVGRCQIEGWKWCGYCLAFQVCFWEMQKFKGFLHSSLFWMRGHPFDAKKENRVHWADQKLMGACGLAQASTYAVDAALVPMAREELATQAVVPMKVCRIDGRYTVLVRHGPDAANLEVGDTVLMHTNGSEETVTFSIWCHAQRFNVYCQVRISVTLICSTWRGNDSIGVIQEIVKRIMHKPIEMCKDALRPVGSCRMAEATWQSCLHSRKSLCRFSI